MEPTDLPRINLEPVLEEKIVDVKNKLKKLDINRRVDFFRNKITQDAGFLHDEIPYKKELPVGSYFITENTANNEKKRNYTLHVKDDPKAEEYHRFNLSFNENSNKLGFKIKDLKAEGNKALTTVRLGKVKHFAAEHSPVKGVTLVAAKEVEQVFNSPILTRLMYQLLVKRINDDLEFREEDYNGIQDFKDCVTYEIPLYPQCFKRGNGIIRTLDKETLNMSTLKYNPRTKEFKDPESFQTLTVNDALGLEFRRNFITWCIEHNVTHVNEAFKIFEDLHLYDNEDEPYELLVQERIPFAFRPSNSAPESTLVAMYCENGSVLQEKLDLEGKLELSKVITGLKEKYDDISDFLVDFNHLHENIHKLKNREISNFNKMLHYDRNNFAVFLFNSQGRNYRYEVEANGDGYAINYKNKKIQVSNFNELKDKLFDLNKDQEEEQMVKAALEEKQRLKAEEQKRQAEEHRLKAQKLEEQSLGSMTRIQWVVKQLKEQQAFLDGSRQEAETLLANYPKKYLFRKSSIANSLAFSVNNPETGILHYLVEFKDGIVKIETFSENFNGTNDDFLPINFVSTCMAQLKREGYESIGSI